MLEERILDLSMREADVAIRLKEPSQAELIRRRLLDVHIRLFASTAYVEKYGLPKTVEELAGHRLITQSPSSPQVRAGAEFVQPFLAAAPSSSLTVNSYFGILQAVIQGLGIGSLPDYLSGPDLVNILPDQKSATIPAFLAYVEELRHSKRVCAFRDFMVEEVAAFRREGASGSASHAAGP
jgi:DNA-binding transcriptional LysR family regulator